MQVGILLACLAIILLVGSYLQRKKIAKIHRRRLFHQLAEYSGLSKEQQALLWHLICVYHIDDIRRLLMNSRLLNVTLARAIREAELDLGMALKERELKQYAYYEIKRHFDRIELLPSIHSTRELAVGNKLQFNQPNDVRLLLLGSCQHVDARSFVVQLEKGLAESWLKFDKGAIFEFTYKDEHKLEYHFDAQLRAFKQDGQSWLLYFKHSRKMRLVMNRRPPSKRVDKEVTFAKSSFDAGKIKEFALIPEKSQQGTLLELSLASAVIKSAQEVGVNQCIYLQFSIEAHTIVCFGRVEQIIHVGSHYQLHVQFLQTSRSSLNQISALVYDL